MLLFCFSTTTAKLRVTYLWEGSSSGGMSLSDSTSAFQLRVLLRRSQSPRACCSTLVCDRACSR